MFTVGALRIIPACKGRNGSSAAVRLTPIQIAEVGFEMNGWTDDQRAVMSVLLTHMLSLGLHEFYPGSPDLDLSPVADFTKMSRDRLPAMDFCWHNFS